MGPRQVFRALRAGWWLLLLGIVVGGGAGAGLSFAQTPLYTSSTQLFVSTTDLNNTSAVYQGSQFSEQRAASYAELIGGEDLAQRVISQLHLTMSSTDLQQEITATAVPNTVLIDVDVTDPSPQRAQQIAKAIGTEFTDLAQTLETPQSGGPTPVKVTVTDQPNLPTTPSSPQTTRNVALGAVLGLLAGSALAIGRVAMDRSVKDPQEAADLVGVPLVGTILRDDALEKKHTIERQDTNRTAEDYRQLRANLQFLNVDEPPKVIMISSAVPGEGKTTLVINLALALTDAGQRVTIVEADLRRPKVTRYLGMVSGVGLTNILAGNAELHEVTQQYQERLSVIAAGPHPPNPGELLASSHMASLLDKLRGENDFVLVDAPPLLPVADSTGLAPAMDGVLLSVRYGSTRKDQVHQAALTLERVAARTLGVVLNIVPPRAEVAGAYGYGYSYGYADGKGRSSSKESRRGRQRSDGQPSPEKGSRSVD